MMRIILSAAAALFFSAGVMSCGSKSNDSNAQGQEEQSVVVEEAEEEASVVIDLPKGESIAPIEGKLVVVDFNATWCGPCKQFAPHFHAVAEKNIDNAVFYSVDVDKHPELAAQYKVESIPMVVYIKADGTTDSTVGYMDEAQFAEAVANHLK